MAKLLRPFRSEKAAGVAGDTTYQRYRGQTLAKVRRGPTVTNSAAQLVIQTLLREAQQAWKTLTDAQRDAWRAFAPLHAPTDRDFGSKGWSGINAYCTCRVQMQRYARDPLTDPPDIDAPTEIVGLAATEDFEGIKLISDGYTNKPGQTVMFEVWATGRHSVGRSMPRSLAKYHLYDSAVAPIVLYVPDQNGRYTFWCRHLDQNTGLTSQFQRIVHDFAV
jgi:hypothetical protein